MTIIIHIEPEKREGMFGPAHALAALEAPVQALEEACAALKVSVSVRRVDSAPPPPAPRVRRSKAEIAAEKTAADAALRDMMQKVASLPQ